MIDAFVPPRTPSGKALRRVPTSTPSHVLVRVALGELIHPTVGTFLEQYRHPGVTSVPITDLPPSQTALLWLAGSRNPRIDAFAETAEMMLSRAETPSAPRQAPHAEGIASKGD